MSLYSMAESRADELRILEKAVEIIKRYLENMSDNITTRGKEKEETDNDRPIQIINHDDDEIISAIQPFMQTMKDIYTNTLMSERRAVYDVVEDNDVEFAALYIKNNKGENKSIETK